MTLILIPLLVWFLYSVKQFINNLFRLDDNQPKDI